MASRRTLTLLVLGALAGALGAAQPALGCSRPIRLIGDEWPPYAYSADGAGQTGLDIELTTAILREAGCTLVSEPYVPALRRLLMFQRGETDLLLAASDTPERRRFARFSSPYRNESIALFGLAQEFDRYRAIAGFDQLLAQDLALLAPTAGWYGKQYERARPRLQAKARLSTFGTVQQGLRMLAAGRAQLIMGDVAALEHEARNQKLALRQLPFVVRQAPVHLMFSRASISAADVALINGAIARLERNGTLKAIRSGYVAR